MCSSNLVNYKCVPGSFGLESTGILDLMKYRIHCYFEYMKYFVIERVVGRVRSKIVRQQVKTMIPRVFTLKKQ